MYIQYKNVHKNLYFYLKKKFKKIKTKYLLLQYTEFIQYTIQIISI